MTKKSKNKSGAEVKQRNPVALNPLMKKSHAHTNNSKSARVKAKRDIKRALEED